MDTSQSTQNSQHSTDIPPLFFSRKWNNLVAQRPRTLNNNKVFKNIKFISRENVVMHISMKPNCYKNCVRMALGCKPIIKAGTGSSLIPKNNHKLAIYSGADLDSPFSHQRFNTGPHGKILHFSKNQNLIRAGKYTHSDSFLSVVRFLKWANFEKSAWFTGLATPNSVMSGAFIGKITDKVKEYPRASFSDKFPGIAISMKSEKSLNCCTPEIYLRRGAFIIPGVKRPSDLAECCEELCKIYSLYKENCIEQ